MVLYEIKNYKIFVDGFFNRKKFNVQVDRIYIMNSKIYV